MGSDRLTSEEGGAGGGGGGGGEEGPGGLARGLVHLGRAHGERGGGPGESESESEMGFLGLKAASERVASKELNRLVGWLLCFRSDLNLMRLALESSGGWRTCCLFTPLPLPFHRSHRHDWFPC
jgi:hypothetical protein